MKTEPNSKTIKKYEQAYTRLLKKGFEKTMTYEQIINTLNKFDIKDSSKLNYVKCIYFKNKIDPFLTDDIKTKMDMYMKNINNVQLERQGQGILTEHQKNNYIEWEKIINLYNTIQDEKDKTIISLYVLFPPRRLLDFANMYVVKRNYKLDETKNYYIRLKNRSYFIFNEYKTKNKYGQQKFLVPKNLSNILNQYIDKYNIQYKSSLFGYTQSNFGQVIRNIFYKISKKYISVNLMRHAYITYMTNNNLLKTKNDRDIVSKKMSHSILTQLSYYVDQ